VPLKILQQIQVVVGHTGSGIQMASAGQQIEGGLHGLHRREVIPAPVVCDRESRADCVRGGERVGGGGRACPQQLRMVAEQLAACQTVENDFGGRLGLPRSVPAALGAQVPPYLVAGVGAVGRR